MDKVIQDFIDVVNKWGMSSNSYVYDYHIDKSEPAKKLKILLSTLGLDRFR
jgi:hypothetical protein